ncbi:hypothetical protein [Bifidobacterium samirii]|uniref:Uncharacterized protein n=1 Tax=Bifidobacterium samirii TaxID=2306974 RepID=A0A430FVA1_9BIFI|nr:hypothetical protein [Bifidobacterium samirii]RSX57713.1 hypothetical protein D2E24_0561 [Bifidobacterium samirii]
MAGSDDNAMDGMNDDDLHFSDADFDALLAGGLDDAPTEPAADATPASQTGGMPADGASGGADDDLAGIVEPDAGESFAAGFDDELAGLLGDKAKAAVLITRIASARLLAAFCQLSDISADCLASQSGAVAVLRNLDGDGPEAAARDITTVVSGMTVVLAVNRADRLDATLYLQGEAGQTFVPPVLFSTTPPFVEDLLLGIAKVADVTAQGVETVSSSSLDREQAMQVLAEHTRFGRGGAGRIE